MKSALVTGGAGFIGSAIVRGLLADGAVERVVVVDSLIAGKEENLVEVDDVIEFHQVDIRDYEALERLSDGIDVVFHEAAIASVPRSIKEPVLCHEINVAGTFNVLRAAHEKKGGRGVFASSAAAYGNAPELPKREGMLPDPQSPYAVHKLLGELDLRTFHDNFDVETVALRYFNVFGPRQDPASPYSGVLSIFCNAALDRRQPTIFGDGEQSRDFVYVDNVVDLNLSAARAKDVSGKLYNCGLGVETTLNQTWDLLQRIEGVDLPASYGPEREGDVKRSVADISAAQRDLGFSPQVSYEEGLRRTLDWYREAPPVGLCPQVEKGASSHASVVRFRSPPA